MVSDRVRAMTVTEDNDPIDMESALLDPARVFPSPEAVLARRELTAAQKREILQRWRQDAIELAVANGEGMQGPDNGLMLSRILAVLRRLETGAEHAEPYGDWNAVVTVYEEGYRPALRVLQQHSLVAKSPYHNVLPVTAEDPVALLEILEQHVAAEPALAASISRIAPAKATFDFISRADFEEKAMSAAKAWLPQLAGASFHVRLHHRGSELDSPTEERLIAESLLAALSAAGTPGRISFHDPDAIIAIDTVDGRAGLGFWTRSDLAHHRFLRPD
jgi:hypothetical protein